MSLPGRIPDLPAAAFSLADLDLVAGEPGPGARLEAPGLKVEGWQDGPAPALNGAPLSLEPFETSRSLDIDPGGRHLRERSGVPHRRQVNP